MTPALLMSGVHFSYGPDRGSVAIGHFEVAPGEKVFLYGPSGVGKSTLLGLAAGTLSPRHGEVTVLGAHFHAMPPAARDRVRADSLGIIFQLFNLIPYLSVFDNVLLPCRFSTVRAARIDRDGGMKAAAGTLLSRLGLEDMAIRSRKVSELSVGQQQRVAAARALIGSPGLILADEPTSALDTETQAAFLKLLLAETERSGAALVFVSHQRELARHFDREVDFSNLAAAEETAS